ncbi:MAG: PAS domain S-box protein [Ferruginibacter sp.]
MKLFESVITNANDSVMITGVESEDGSGPKIVYVNEAFTKMTGYSCDEIIGKTPRILQGLKSDKNALSLLRQSIEKMENCEIETINYKKNGEEFWINFSVVPMSDGKGDFSHWISIARDITSRKRQDAEKEVFFNLVQSLGKLELGEAWYKILESICFYCGLEYAEAWMVNIDHSHLLLHKRWANNELAEKLIVAGKVIKIKKGEGLTGNAWLNNKVAYINDITNHASYLAEKSEVECRHNSAAYIPVLYRGHTIALLCFYSTKIEMDNNNFKTLFENISQQLGPYVQNKRSEDELARFFNLSPDFLAIAGTDGYFKKINPAFSKILGYSSKELFDKPISHFTHPGDREITENRRNRLREGYPLLDFENRYLTKNGETRWFSWTSTPLPEEGLIFAVGKDTTEKRKLDDEKKRILESISDFFFALDKDFNFTYMNSATEKLFRIKPGELIGKNIWEEWPSFEKGIFFETMQKSIKSKVRVSFEFYDKTSNGWFEESFYPSDDGLSVFFRSINERKVAEKALKEAFKEKDTILESIGDAFFAVDRSWTVTYWNKMSEQLLKVNRENIVGKNLWDIFAESVSSLSYINYHKAIDNNEVIHFDDYFELLNIWLEVSAYPSPGGLSVYFKDISLRKKAEDSIRTSNERYDMVAKATNDAIWDWDLVTNQVVRPGKRLETMFGYDDCEAGEVDDFWNTHVHPGDWMEVTKNRNALFANPAENYWEDEYRFMTTEGEYAYVNDKGYIIRNKDGKAIRMIGASKDITKDKEQVNEISRIRKNLDSLINTTTDLIWSINTEFRIIAANKAYSDAIQAITGNPVKEGDNAIFPSTDTEIKDKWTRFYTIALSGETFHFEESFYNPTVRDPWHTIVSFSPIITRNGEISGVACFAKDITELKKAGQKLLELNNSLEKRAGELASSNSELEQFAYVASHDLQEPLRMVSSFLQLLERKYHDKLDETARKYIQFSVDGADRMKQLINDLLQYSKIGTASLEIVPVDMNEVLTGVLMLFKNEANTIDAEIIVENLPVIHAGKLAMSQLMQNLVGNALKYRSKEKPVVTISGKEEKDEWIFTVKDNGIGIDSKFSDKIFIIFQRLHHKDQFNGTGIGLAICKKIIERYHGKIWVESEFGKGSKFIFAIPKKHN